MNYSTVRFSQPGRYPHASNAKFPDVPDDRFRSRACGGFGPNQPNFPSRPRRATVTGATTGNGRGFGVGTVAFYSPRTGTSHTVPNLLATWGDAGGRFHVDGLFGLYHKMALTSTWRREVGTTFTRLPRPTSRWGPAWGSLARQKTAPLPDRPLSGISRWNSARRFGSFIVSQRGALGRAGAGPLHAGYGSQP